MKNLIITFAKKIRSYARAALVYLDFYKFRRLPSGTRLPIRLNEIRPCVDDRSKKTNFDRHYIYHTAWASRVLSETKTLKHVDISSTLYFSSIVSAFIPVSFYDYRPAELNLSNLDAKFADLTKLPFEDNSIPSLSCMHTVEHIGLGRYGDPLDPGGDLIAMKELSRVLAIGGNLLFVVPVGRPKVIFNAHRIYSYSQIIDAFSHLTLQEFALIPDTQNDGGLIRNAPPEIADRQNYGCGCFWFKKT